jgi:pimeloyl-ACP methyl ester carboxylesterase
VSKSRNSKSVISQRPRTKCIGFKVPSLVSNVVVLMEDKRYNRDFVIVLVHGTWARGAEWMGPNSTFCSTLTDELSSLGAKSIAIIRDFQWTGWNTHEDRRKGAVCLRKRLMAIIRQAPDVSVFVIAHSHGGNVALRAIHRSSYLKSRISGVVCIATPFLKFSRASLMLVLLPTMLTSAADWVRSWLPIYLFAVAVMLPLRLLLSLLGSFFKWLFGLPWWFFPTTGQLMDHCEGCGRNTIYVMLIAGVIITLAYIGAAIDKGRTLALNRSGRLLGASRRRLFDRFSYSQPEERLRGIALLSLSSALDEARGVLSGSWWLHRSSRWLAFLTIGVTFTSAGLIIGWGFYGANKVANWMSKLIPSGVWEELAIVLTFIFAASILVGLVSAVIKLVAIASTYLSPGLRLGDANSNLLLNVKAHRSPGNLPGTRQYRYSTFELLRGSREFLFHSRVYSFPPAIRDVALWMYEMASSAEREGPRGRCRGR